ncbi:MAG: hypothetical protein WAZ18_02920 [Alphaproteobacteria bacterium]
MSRITFSSDIPPVSYEFIQEMKTASIFFKLPPTTCLPQHLQGTILTPRDYLRNHQYFMGLWASSHQRSQIKQSLGQIFSPQNPEAAKLKNFIDYSPSALTHLEEDIMAAADILCALAEATVVESRQV